MTYPLHSIIRSTIDIGSTYIDTTPIERRTRTDNKIRSILVIPNMLVNPESQTEKTASFKEKLTIMD